MAQYQVTLSNGAVGSFEAPDLTSAQALAQAVIDDQANQNPDWGTPPTIVNVADSTPLQANVNIDGQSYIETPISVGNDVVLSDLSPVNPIGIDPQLGGGQLNG